MLKTISELYKKSNEISGAKRLVLASAADDHSLDAVFKAREQNIIEPINPIMNKIKIISFFKIFLIIAKFFFPIFKTYY